MRILALDPVELTIYRFFWLLGVSDNIAAEKDWKNMRPLLKTAAASPSTLSGSHTSFIQHWIEFAYLHEPRIGAIALSYLASAILNQKLISNLHDLAGPDAPPDLIAQATARVIRLVQDYWYATVASLWENRQFTGVLVLIRAATQSKLSRTGWELAAEASLVPEIERWRDTIEQSDCSREQLLDATFLNERVMELGQLHEIFETLAPHTPRAGLWAEDVRRQASKIAAPVRDEAIEVANTRSDWNQAVSLIKQIMPLPLSQTWRETLANDMETLKVNQAKRFQQEKERESGIVPISGPPSLGTLNTVGFKVYGNEPFDNSGRYFTVLYFVALFLPLLPLQRYLVSDAPGGGWYFHAKAPFTKSMKAHLAVSLSLIIAFGWSVNNSPSTPETTSSASATDSTASGPSAASSDQGASVTSADSSDDAATAKLRTDLNHLKSEIDEAKLSLSEQESDLKDRAQQIAVLEKTIDRDRPHMSSATDDELAQFNATVRRHNSELESAKAAYKSYKSTLARVKASIERYNKMVDSLNGPGAATQ